MLEDSRIREAASEVVAGLVGHRVTEHETLISSGLLDSLSILRLIGELEKALGITIPTDSAQPDDFDSIALIVETVRRVAPPAV